MDVKAVLAVAKVVQVVLAVQLMIQIGVETTSNPAPISKLAKTQQMGVSKTNLNTHFIVILPTKKQMEQIKQHTESWKGSLAKQITFIVTKDCQLACKYCYLVGKNSNEKMSWEVAKKAIDYFISHEDEFPEESVIWDFIGASLF